MLLNNNFKNQCSHNAKENDKNIHEKKAPAWIIWLRDNLNSKDLSSDNRYSFNFKNSNWYLTIIYLVSFIILPILYSIIKRYAFGIIPTATGDVPNPWGGLDIVFMYLMPIIGMSLSFAFDWKTMIKKGAWAAYSHFIFGFASALFIGIFLVGVGVLSKDPLNPTFLAVSFFVQILFQLAGSILVILSSKQLRMQIWTTLKEAKIDLVVWTIIFIAIGYVLSAIFSQIASTYQSSDDNSANQQQLIAMTATPFGIFAFIFGTIFIAPINEEISYRYGTFNIVRNKSLGFVASLIYFPAMHIMQAGDWNNLLSYMGMAIILPSLFVFARGNTTYSIGAHMTWNTIAAIVTLITIKR